MNCPICNTSIEDGSLSCSSCGADLASHGADARGEFIFCEGCGARLSPQERTCPKCGRPAPGILSPDSAAHDLAAGKTASFPRLTSESIAGSVPAPSSISISELLASSSDADSTSVMDAAALTAVQGPHARADAHLSARAASPQGGSPAHDGPDPHVKRRRRRWAAFAAALVFIALAFGFAALDPMGVMPGLYESFGRAASDAFPSRVDSDTATAADDAAVDETPSEEAGEGLSKNRHKVNDSTLSEAEAFQRLSAIYGQILMLEDEIGPVVKTYNGQYLAKDRNQRDAASKDAYDLRGKIQATIDEIGNLELADGSAYKEDVDHLRQLATWTFNRVDVLCRSWDINLALPDGETPLMHQDEILEPLRAVDKIGDKAADVVQYEENVSAWKPVEK